MVWKGGLLGEVEGCGGGESRQGGGRRGLFGDVFVPETAPEGDRGGGEKEGENGGDDAARAGSGVERLAEEQGDHETAEPAEKGPAQADHDVGELDVHAPIVRPGGAFCKNGNARAEAEKRRRMAREGVWGLDRGRGEG